MNLIYPVGKGDQLCPLGFHPQVRWPTRCKRCFRDYKEHGNKRGMEDITASSPLLTDTSSRFTSPGSFEQTVRSWTSSQNLSTITNNEPPVPAHRVTLPRRPASWASSPEIEKEKQQADVVVNLKLPIKERRKTINLDEVTETITIRKSPVPPSPTTESESIKIVPGDSLADRVRKMQLLRKQSSLERESSKEREPEPEAKKAESRKKLVNASTDTTKQKPPDLPIKPPPPADNKKEKSEATTRRRRTTAETNTTSETEAEKLLRRRRPESSTTNTTSNNSLKKSVDTGTNSTQSDVQFLIQLKDTNKKEKKSQHDDSISTCTETTDTTLVDNREILEELESLKRELENWKSRCERAERDKSDILLRRISSMDTGTNRTAASEVLKLQQKVNEMRSELEDLRDEKRSLSTKVKELENDLDARPSKSVEEMLRAKLEQAESLCEELMDENEEMKKEIRNMETEMDEMHDSFREDQADEYSRLKKELEQTTKNCRILSFKLKKSDRKIEQLESEKQALGVQSGVDLVAKINRLEEDLRVANEVARRLQIENEMGDKKRPPSIGSIGRSNSAETKVSRASLTRGGSQEDPVQLLRDLQDSIEREHDLREQLKFTEEEAENLRTKVSRIEDENESLVMQLKKMANKAKNRKSSPTAPSRRAHLEPPTERDEGIDEDDPAELRLQLELNEQETVVLRRRIDELEKDNNSSKQKIKALEEKLEAKTKEVATKSKITRPKLTTDKESPKDSLNEKKIQVMEDEINELRKKVIEKDRDIERLETEMSLNKKPKNMLQKTKSLDLNVTEQQNLDFKRQLQTVEQEASVLRGKVQKMEQDNDKLNAEVKKLQLQLARAKASSKEKGLNDIGNDKNKEAIEKLQKEKEELSNKLKKILEEPIDKLPTRVPKKYSEMYQKSQLKKMIEELEEEVTEMRAIVMRTGADKLKNLETEKQKLETQLQDTEKRYETAQKEIKLLKSKTEDESTSATKIKDQLKSEKDKVSKLEKDIEKEKKERQKIETKHLELQNELQQVKKAQDKTKSELEKEITQLKSRALQSELPSKKMSEIREQNKDLEEKLFKEHKRYDDLCKKYDLLDEEHNHYKVRITADKESLEYELKKIKSELNSLKSNENKLKQENKDLNDRVLDLQKAMNNRSSKEAQLVSLENEKTRYKNLMEDALRELEKKKHENDMNCDLLSQLRREADDLKRRLDDFERIDKAQRTLSEHNTALEKEIKSLKTKLETAEIQSKSEVAATRLRYEQQANHLQTELGSLQRQCERFKRDRDSFKQLLESAQKTISDLKQNRKSLASISSSGDEDDKSKIAILEQQVGCLEDQLSESRLEASKLRTELVSEKSSADVKISELQSKFNEYEEERLLGSGRTRLTGAKTKLELSWQKEREEQQRLVQETATLARDLRQTLFEVERERDKERLEAKRKIETIKKSTEEELEEGRRKITELQSDLLELRDVHAKLRTANEKLRRDRDRYEKEALKRKLEHDGERKVGALLQTVDELVKIAPELQIKSDATNTTSSKSATLPIPSPRRSKSRSPSPQRRPQPANLDITTILARLAEASEELRRFQRLADEDRIRERARRSGMRRAASTEADDKQSPMLGRRLGHHHNLNRNGSLQKKSLSLDQSMNKDQMIWKQESFDDSMSSMQSIDSEYGESRLSESSVQSDLPRLRKKKKSLMSKLRSSLTKSRGSDSEVSRHGSDSDLSLAGEVATSSKKDLSKRISGMFKRAGSSSRGNSVEKTVVNAESAGNGSASQQRPVSVGAVKSGDKHLSTKSTSSKPPMPNSQSRKMSK